MTGARWRVILLVAVLLIAAAAAYFGWATAPVTAPTTATEATDVRP